MEESSTNPRKICGISKLFGILFFKISHSRLRRLAKFAVNAWTIRALLLVSSTRVIQALLAVRTLYRGLALVMEILQFLNRVVEEP